jgi:recombinational DNA repair protein RecT
MVYMIARLKDGSVQTEVMTIEDVNRIRARSQSANDGPWATDYTEMARKTVLKRGCKYLPMSAEMVSAFEHDDATELPAADFTLLTEVQTHALPADTGNAPVSKVKDAVRVATSKKAAPAVVDVVDGESEEAAWARANGEPPPGMVLPTGNEPPPPTDADAP